MNLWASYACRVQKYASNKHPGSGITHHCKTLYVWLLETEHAGAVFLKGVPFL